MNNLMLESGWTIDYKTKRTKPKIKPVKFCLMKSLSFTTWWQGVWDTTGSPTICPLLRIQDLHPTED